MRTQAIHGGERVYVYCDDEVVCETFEDYAYSFLRTPGSTRSVEVFCGTSCARESSITMARVNIVMQSCKSS